MESTVFNPRENHGRGAIDRKAVVRVTRSTRDVSEAATARFVDVVPASESEQATMARLARVEAGEPAGVGMEYRVLEFEDIDEGQLVEVQMRVNPSLRQRGIIVAKRLDEFEYDVVIETGGRDRLCVVDAREVRRMHWIAVLKHDVTCSFLCASQKALNAFFVSEPDGRAYADVPTLIRAPCLRRRTA